MWATPSILISHQLLSGWVGAVTIAVALTIIINMFLRASHPPTAAATLLVSLGAFKTPPQILSIIIGVLILAIIGEMLRRIRTGGNTTK